MLEEGEREAAQEVAKAAWALNVRVRRSAGATRAAVVRLLCRSRASQGHLMILGMLLAFPHE
jgi:hypothetical protein